MPVLCAGLQEFDGVLSESTEALLATKLIQGAFLLIYWQ